MNTVVASEPAAPKDKGRKPAFRPGGGMRQSGVTKFVMAACIIVLGTYLVYPIVLLVILSFNTNRLFLVGTPQWGVDNWIHAWAFPGLLESIWNSFVVWFLESLFSFPIAIAIALLLARTNVPKARGLEFMFWIAFIFPSLAATFGWVMMLSPKWGFLNQLISFLPGVREGPFNIYSLKGIIWVKVIGDNLAFKIILLTAAFRNMDGALEEAARISGSSNIRTMLRVTLPVMVAPIVLTMSLQFVTVFKGFETEFILGSHFGYFVYSTLIYRLVRLDVPAQYGNAVVLASITVVLIALIIPFQRWITGRKQYTTIDSSFKPGLIDLGKWRKLVFGGILSVAMLQTVVPALVLVAGSFMTRVGFFNTKPVWTFEHWHDVLTRAEFLNAFKTTLILSIVCGLISPILYSLFAYIIVRTRMKGRNVLDSIIWAAAAMPGPLVGLGLLLMFIKTPVLDNLFGTIWVLLITVAISGVTTGTNIFKGVLLQVGASLEEAGRVSGAGWWRTYFKVVVPVLMPTMVLVGMMNFVHAAGVTSSIVLLASQDTQTLSLLALHYGASRGGQLEEAGIISIIIMLLTMGVALPFRALALRMGVRHDVTAGGTGPRKNRPGGKNGKAHTNGVATPVDEALDPARVMESV
jgi:iron(III) transport system permease protein